MAPRAQLPPEIQLAQRLAGNEQVARDRAVRKLRKYIVARSQGAAGGFTHDELLKVWKGLFYCMWMQDKPLLQEELGRTISQLIHAFQTTEAQHLFLQTFWQTMNREWTGIDRLRLDKFYMLMRMVLNESLKALKTQGWEERQIEQLLELLTTEILHPDSQAPSGVKSHFLEIFLEELSKVGAAELTADQNLRFIDPFCTIAARTKDSLVLHNITRGIFEAIVEQAPFAIEDLLNEVDSQEEEEDDDDEDNEDGMSEDDECKQDVPSGKPGSLRGAACNPSNEPAEDGEDSVGPVLQFDYEAVASRLFAVASQQSTPSQNRKRLYKVIRKLQDLAEGLFPEDDVPEKAYRNLQEEGRDQRTKKRLPTSTSHKSGVPRSPVHRGQRSVHRWRRDRHDVGIHTRTGTLLRHRKDREMADIGCVVWTWDSAPFHMCYSRPRLRSSDPPPTPGHLLTMRGGDSAASARNCLPGTSPHFPSTGFGAKPRPTG
ncbi:ribosomal RNA processing protein 1 homolog A isoform X1 [Canis lupus dingo]|uniref:ribosomal RNA processing protein 1 homolog A isoform X1 n=2 Tax=Canis lupus dingo TaxID=286419 RepID=UPI000DC6BBFD|nr:ribosomal RNA processing protein 1 homolog A isoform X1 [Canis lupus dingo]